MSITYHIEREFIPRPGKTTVISLVEFLRMLKTEEDYFIGEQCDTLLMFTRLRKIFYDKYGWDKELIRRAKHIEGRYQVVLVPVESDVRPELPKLQGKHSHNSKDFTLTAHHIRSVTVKSGDWMRPNDAGKPAEIYQNNNQEVVLPTGWYCDIGHVLTGVDAWNWCAPVSPFPWLPMPIRKIFPIVYENTDVATWLGDIASAIGEFLFELLHRKKLIFEKGIGAEEQQNRIKKYIPGYKVSGKVKWKSIKKQLTLPHDVLQQIMDDYAPAQDMLGNIDSYVIYEAYNSKSRQGLRVSEILMDYYCQGGVGEYLRAHRYSFFCKAIGLKGWDGDCFRNEDSWLKSYKKQLRDCTAMYIFTRSEKPLGYWLAAKVWLNLYKYFSDIDYHYHMVLFLNTMKDYIKKEPKNDLNFNCCKP